MRRPRKTPEQLKRLYELVDKNNTDENRRRRLYNRKYRKSVFFISSWIVRIIYVILFFVVCFTHNITYNSNEEIVLAVNYSNYTKSKGGIATLLTFETNYGNYSDEFDYGRVPTIKIKDTIIIESNFYGKEIYFTKPTWNVKFGFADNYILYYCVTFLTVFSFFLNDGLDGFSDKLLLFIWVINILSITLYFFA